MFPFLIFNFSSKELSFALNALKFEFTETSNTVMLLLAILKSAKEVKLLTSMVESWLLKT